MQYGIGLSYNDESGVMKGSDRQIMSGNIDLTYRKNSLIFSNKFNVDLVNSKREPVEFSKFAEIVTRKAGCVVVSYRNVIENGK